MARAAYDTFSDHKHHRTTVKEFEDNLETNLKVIIDEIITESWKPAEYTEKIIYEKNSANFYGGKGGYSEGIWKSAIDKIVLYVCGLTKTHIFLLSGDNSHLPFVPLKSVFICSFILSYPYSC